jgi:hypothetical protein
MSMKSQRQLSLVNFLETVHIPLWLIKDICWLMEYRTLGVIVAFPTVLVALVMVVISFKDKVLIWTNLSILFWILANANWMLAEFYNWPTKNYSIWPFLIGLLTFSIFLLIKLMERRKSLIKN